MQKKLSKPVTENTEEIKNSSTDSLESELIDSE